jgi:phage-related minor tail protein
MSDSYEFNDSFVAKPIPGGDEFTEALERARKSTNALGISANTFANAMRKAFADATVGGKQFDDVLKSMALKLSGVAVSQAFKPIAKEISKGVTSIIGELFPDLFPSGGGGGRGGESEGDGRCNCCCQSQAATSGGCFGMSTCFFAPGRVTIPFASGGIINTPSYFPLNNGGLGLAGEAGPEAIVPLSRGPDGRLGIAGSGGQGGNITVQIMAPDPGSFRRSEAYITGQIARAVARGQRGF